MMNEIIEALTVGEILAVAATLTAIVVLVRRIHRGMKRITDVLDDWQGEQARPGVPERKGVMQRLSDQDKTLEEVKASIDPLIDARVEGNHREVLHRLDDISGATHLNGGHLRRLERLLLQHIRESKAWVSELDRRAAERDFEVPPWPNLPDRDEGAGDDPPTKGK